MRPSARLAKRAFDIFFGVVLQIPTLPLMVWTSVRILRHDGWPVLYAARRIGQHGRPFVQYKFRTMVQDAGPEKGVSGGDKAHRITPLGHKLRAARLDELPQMFNVLNGTMSFVGPRPPAPQYAERFPEIYREVLEMKPGITGLATVMFHVHEETLLRDTTSAAETDEIYVRRCVPRKAALDLLYRENWSMCLDLYLIYLTLGKGFRWPGARLDRMRARARRLRET
jgi:lipopolysaccharide/colanic/teichoic acid biosynthesis glycosyltransferase